MLICLRARTGLMVLFALFVCALFLAGASRAWAQSPPLLPDSGMTPGATLPVTKADLCVPGYTKKVRNVPQDVKDQVYAEYGITAHQPGEYEVDHLISLELGGSNSIKNLWPQSYRTQPWNAHVKDALENELHREVCNGSLDLATAQHDIATDWIAAYKKYFHTQMPLALARTGGRMRRGMMPPSTSRRPGFHFHLPFSTSPPPISDPGPGQPNAAPSTGAAAQTQVWVNTKSGKYFLPGARYYGKTKQGAYMTESQAKAQGYVAAGGN